VGTWGYTFHDLNIRWYPLVVALLIIPMGMIRLIKLLVPFSMIANGLISVSAAVLFYFIFTDDGGRDPLRPEERSKLVVWPMTRWSLFAGSALCSMEGVGMVSIVYFKIFFFDTTKQDKILCVITSFRIDFLVISRLWKYQILFIILCVL